MRKPRFEFVSAFEGGNVLLSAEGGGENKGQKRWERPPLRYVLQDRNGTWGRKKWRETGWLLDDERTARQDCIGSWGTDREGVGVERNTRGWERRTISILIPPWGGVDGTNRREDANTDGTPLPPRCWRESALGCNSCSLRSRLCTPVSRPLLYQRAATRPCRFIPVLLPRHTCFCEYGGPRCARIFAARWNFVISIPGNPERLSLPPTPPLGEKKPNEMRYHACLRAFFPALRASHSWHRSIDRYSRIRDVRWA